MATRKKSGDAPTAPFAFLGVLRVMSSELMIGAGLLLILVTIGYYGWKKWGVPITEQAEYKLSPGSVVVTPLPAWIRSDIKAEAMRDGSLEGLSIFDKDLTLRVCHAFEMHAWVERVDCVSKRPPNRIVVELEYRKPVAWVEVPAGVLPTNEVGLLPVDKKGTLLPTGDFTAAQANDYPRIAVSNLAPCGLAGTSWGDPRVAACAQIAALLEEESLPLALHRILAVEPDDGSSGGGTLYRLTTRKGLRIIWGNPPGGERTGEPTAAQKKLALRALAQTLAKSDPPPEGKEIDLRLVEGPMSGPRTAVRSAPATH